MEEWCDEMWNMAINDKSLCEIKIRKGILKCIDFLKISDSFFGICVS